MTKSFSGSLVDVLVSPGPLSPDDLVTDIIPEVAGSAYDGVKLRHVLDMTVAVNFDEDYENPRAMLRSSTWRRAGVHPGKA